MPSDTAPHPGDIYAAWPAHLAELEARYPEQFAGKNIGRYWPDGWHALVAGVCAYAAAHHIPVCWYQIKDKFGGLRMYGVRNPLRASIQMAGQARSVLADPVGARTIPDLYKQVMAAQEMSHRTCCRCGSSDPADHVIRREFGGWLLVACDRCASLIDEYRTRPRTDW